MNIVTLNNGTFELLSPLGNKSYGIFNTYYKAKREYARLIFDPTVKYFTDEE